MNNFKRLVSVYISFCIFLFSFVNSNAKIILNENIINTFRKKNNYNTNSIENNIDLLDYNVEVDDSTFNDSEQIKDESNKNGVVLTNSNIIYTINYSVASINNYDTKINGDIIFEIKINYGESDLKINNITTDNYEIKKENSSQTLIIKRFYNEENETECIPNISSVSFSFTPSSNLAGKKILPNICASIQDKKYSFENKVREVLVVGNNLSLKFNIQSSSKYKSTKISASASSLYGTVKKTGLKGDSLTGDISDYLVKIEKLDSNGIGNYFLKKGDLIDVDLMCTSTVNQKDVKTIIYDIISNSDDNIKITNIKQSAYISIQFEINSDTSSFHVLALHSLNLENYKEKFQLNISFSNPKVNQKSIDIKNNTFASYRDYLGTGDWVTYHSLLKYNNSENSLEDGVINHLEMAYDSNEQIKTEDRAHILGLIGAYKPLSARIPHGEVFYANGNLYTKNVNENSFYKSFDYICFFDSDVVEPYTEGNSLVNNGDMEGAVTTSDKSLESFKRQAEAYNGSNGEVHTYYIGRNNKLTKKEQVSIEIKDSSLIYYKDYKQLVKDNKKCVGVCVSFRNGSINPVRRKSGELYLFASALTPLIIKNNNDSQNISSNITWTFAGSSSNLGNKSLENNFVYEITNPYKEYDYISSPMHLYFWCNNKSKSLYGIGNDSLFSTWKEWDYSDSYIESTVWENNTYTIPPARRDESFDRYGICVKGIEILPKIKIELSKNIITNENGSLDVFLNIDYSSFKNIKNEENIFEVNLNIADVFKIKKDNSFFINEDAVNNYNYKNGKISIDVVKTLNSPTDIIKIKLESTSTDNNTYELTASIKEKNSNTIPSIYNNTLDRKNIFIRKNNYQYIDSNAKKKEEVPNNPVEVDTKLLIKDNLEENIEAITFISNKEDNVSIIKGELVKRYLVVDITDLSEEELLNLNIKGTNEIYSNEISYTTLKNYSKKITNNILPLNISNLEIPNSNILSYELPLDTKAVKISFNSLNKNELNINYRIIYEDKNNGNSIYLQNSYLINNKLELYTKSPSVKINIDSNYYDVKYITDGNGTVVGEMSESIEESSSPIGRDEQANDKYIFTFWTCDKDIELKSGEILKAEEELSMDQIKNCLVKDNLIFTAHYRQVPILSVEKKSSKDVYNSSEIIDYTITITQIVKDTFATNVDIEDYLENEGIVFSDIILDNRLEFVYKNDTGFKAYCNRLGYNENIIIKASVKILNEEKEGEVFTSEKAINNVYVDCDEYKKFNIDKARSKAEPYVYHKIDIKVINGNILGIEQGYRVKEDESCEYIKDNIISGSNQVFYYEPDNNYYLYEIKVDGNIVNKEKYLNSYVFENIIKNHNIEIFYKEIPDFDIVKNSSKDLLDIEDNGIEYIITIKKDEKERIASNLYIEDIIEDGLKIDTSSINIDKNNLKYITKKNDNGFEIAFNDEVVLDSDINITYMAYIDNYDAIIKNHINEERPFVENYTRIRADGTSYKEAYALTLLNRPSMTLEKLQINDSINVGEYNEYKITIKQNKRGMIAKNIIVEDNISESLEIIPKTIRLQYIESKSNKINDIKPDYELLSADKGKIVLNIKNLSSGYLELTYEAKGIRADSTAENIVNISNDIYDINSRSSTKTQIFENVIKSDRIVKTGDILIYIIMVIMCTIIIINNNIEVKKTPIRKK